MMKIWGRHTSINVQKVLWTCDELALPYERIDVGGEFGGLDAAEFRRRNPNGRIPVIEDEGFVLWESNAIVRYLAAKHGIGTLCPEDLRAQADCDRWMDWQICNILPGLRTLFFGLIRTAPEKRDNAAIEEARVTTQEFWAVLDAHLAPRRYLTGEHFTMADIPLGAFAYRWLALPIERPALPALAAWHGRLAEREPFRRNVMLPLR